VASVAPAPTQVGVPPTVVGAAAVSGTPAAQPAIPQESGGAGSPVPAGSPAAAGPSPSAAAGASPVAAAKPAATPTPTPNATVSITPDRRFDPAQVSINVGETVLWRNTGRNPQTVTCDPIRATDKSHVALPAGADPFDSGVINANGSYSHRFDTAGSYTYFSIPFESQNMTGQVTVR
jgi:plastocyanin